MATFSGSQDPQDKLDRTFDWSQWLTGGETISTSTWSVTPSGPTTSSLSNTTTTATVWLTGGTAGQVYAVTNHIITSAGREADRTLNLAIADL